MCLYPFHSYPQLIALHSVIFISCNLWVWNEIYVVWTTRGYCYLNNRDSRAHMRTVIGICEVNYSPNDDKIEALHSARWASYMCVISIYIIWILDSDTNYFKCKVSANDCKSIPYGYPLYPNNTLYIGQNIRAFNTIHVNTVFPMGKCWYVLSYLGKNLYIFFHIYGHTSAVTCTSLHPAVRIYSPC